jgi:hypothetical protein
MATTSLPGLEAFVAELGLGPIPSFATADVLNDPMDLCHSYLAEYFQQLVGCDRGLVYKAIQPPNTIQDGDLDIVLPRLKLPGGSPKELAGELLKQVCRHSSAFLDGRTNLTCFFHLDSPSHTLRISFPGRDPYSTLFLPEDHPTTPPSLYQRPQTYIWHCQILWPTTRAWFWTQEGSR